MRGALILNFIRRRPTSDNFGMHRMQGDFMMRMVSRFICMLIVLWTLSPVIGDAAASELHIDGDQISVHAERVPLQNLLQQLQAAGITVRIDPALNPLTTADFDRRDLEDGIKSLIRPLNSIFIWKSGRRPAGSPKDAGYRLAEIQIFKPGEKDRMVYLQEEPDTAGEQAPTEDHGEPAASETPVIIKADRVYVPVVLGYNDKKIETNLILDTGANSIVIHQNVAEALGITTHVAAKGYGVGGIEINAGVARLQSVQVGPFEKRNLRAAIVDYSGPPDGQYDGLLGMNFLKGLKYEIDFDAQVIRWGEQSAKKQ
jgi:clan AA aspartic protease (TIGR02281 family)